MEKSIKKYFPIFALPTILAFVTFFLIPFILGIYLSFCEFTTITDATFVGAKNYLEIFKFPLVEQTTYDRCECTAINQIYPILSDKVVGDIVAADIKNLLNHYDMILWCF